MAIKSDFRLRLLRLNAVISYSLEHDTFHGNLFPYLASVVRYMWSNIDERKYLKK